MKRSAGLCGALLIVAVGCSHEAADPVGPASEFVGVIESVVPDAPAEDALGGVLLRVGRREVGLVVRPFTVIAVGGGHIDDLRPGMRIRVITGPGEYLSNPAQYDAARITRD